MIIVDRNGVEYCVGVLLVSGALTESGSYSSVVYDAEGVAYIGTRLSTTIGSGSGSGSG